MMYLFMCFVYSFFLDLDRFKETVVGQGDLNVRQIGIYRIILLKRYKDLKISCFGYLVYNIVICI